MSKKCIRKFTISIFLMLFFSGSGIGAADEYESLAKKIDGIVRAEEKVDLFSGTVLVAHKGGIIYSAAVGYADRDHLVKNTLNTRFNIGSIGKSYTATLIMQLVEQGKVKLIDPLGMYVTDFPHPEKDKIQIKHLLNHSSGLANYMDHKDYGCKMHHMRKISDALPLIFDQEILFQPGERFSYSNSGMVMLGTIIEKVTGMQYKEYLYKQILQPLGMVDSGIIYADEVVPNRATGYRHLPEKGRYGVEIFGEPPAFSDGGLYSTAGDMLKFDQALYGEKLLSEEYKTIMFTPVGPSETYAFGWGSFSRAKTRIIGHSGGCPGFNAIFSRYPEKGYTLIVLSNYDGGAGSIAGSIEAALLDQPYELATEYDFNFRLGYTLQDRGDFRQAVELFSKNLQGDKPHLPSLYQSARAKILGKFDLEKALAELDQYIELADDKAQPSKAAAWWRKGVAYEQMEQVEKAIGCFQKSLELDPQFPEAKDSLEKLLKTKK